MINSQFKDPDNFYLFIEKIHASVLSMRTYTPFGQLTKSCFNETHLESDFNGTRFQLYVMFSEIKYRFAALPAAHPQTAGNLSH